MERLPPFWAVLLLVLSLYAVRVVALPPALSAVLRGLETIRPPIPRGFSRSGGRAPAGVPFSHGTALNHFAFQPHGGGPVPIPNAPIAAGIVQFILDAHAAVHAQRTPLPTTRPPMALEPKHGSDPKLVVPLITFGW